MNLSKTGILIALITPEQSSTKTQEYLRELAFLASTWHIDTVRTFTQRLHVPSHTTFIGKGKAQEIAHFIKSENIGYAIFDDSLSPSQVRNLEKLFSCTILDRNLLIFNIFSMRAKTKQAKIQIELAKYQYLLPRLPKMWKHLTNQKGGKAGMHGPGEKELETDKRIIQDKISTLKNRLKSIEQQCNTRRKPRANYIRVALVGYTNVGKSTLMQLLSKSTVLTEDKLFATVDTTIRKVVLNNQAFLLTDTVGFIRKLPHTLVECFKATLTEVKEADLLLHIIDPSLPALHEQIAVVDKTLEAIQADMKPKILVFNKIDVLENETIPLETSSYQYILNHPTVYVSATKQLNIESLKKTIVSEIIKIQKRKYIKQTY